ncbi:MAG: helix-turn-helix domain-containing protein, partial [Nitrososphaera sp.]
LGSLSGWEVLEELREAGIDGMMVNEIADKLDLPTSTVYNVLRHLGAAGLVKVKRYKKKIGAPDKTRRQDELRTGKKKRIYLEDINWGATSFDDDFGDFVDKNLIDIINKSDIAKQCTFLIDKLIVAMKADPDGKEMLPDKKICPNCDRDHEAVELMWAFLLAISQSVLSSEELEEKCKQHGLKV